MARLAEQLDRIEQMLETLLGERIPQEYYSTTEAAKILERADFTVREWCRHGRVLAEKRACGRGNSREWMISHDELIRIQSEGLLPSHSQLIAADCRRHQTRLT